MIRQAKAYFKGALSAAVLIGFAVTGFVVLALLSGLHAFPLAGFAPGGGGVVELGPAVLGGGGARGGAG